MQAMGGVGGAGSARHEADAWPPGQLAVGLGHHRRATLIAADHHVDGRVMHGVERGKIAFAGHAGEAFYPLRDELIDEDLSAGAAAQSLAHALLLCG